MTFPEQERVVHVTDLCERMARWAVGYRLDTRRAAVVRRLVRDFAGCVAKGSQRAELGMALRLARPGEVRVWGCPQSFDAPSAALVYGTAGSLLQLHDVYVPALLHPSCTVIAAALAARGDRHVDSERFLQAVAVGYELCNRLGDAYRSGPPRSFAVATATAGALGASVTAALIQGGDAALVARTLSLAPMLMPVTPVAAVRTHAEATALHGGLAARAAIEASLLAGETQRVVRVFEGDASAPGYWHALSGREITLDPDRWCDSTLDAVIGKRWPGCFGAYAALEAVLNMSLPQAEQIKRVSIGLPRRLLPMVELGPSSGLLYDRLMSVRWLVARALLRSRLGWDDLDNDEQTDRLVTRIELHHDVALDALPARIFASDVEIDSGTRQLQRWRRELHDDSVERRGTLLHDEPLAWRRKYEALSAEVPGFDADILDVLGED